MYYFLMSSKTSTIYHLTNFQKSRRYKYDYNILNSVKFTYKIKISKK